MMAGKLAALTHPLFERYSYFSKSAYNTQVPFEWNTNKSAVNKEKHGIDFEAAQELWQDENLLDFPSKYPSESRRITIGKIGYTYWMAIYTVRKQTIRIISIRRSRYEERTLYEKEIGKIDECGKP